MIWPSLEPHLTNFVVIRTHLSCHLHRVVDYLGLRRNGSSSQIINQGQDFLEQALWHGNLRQLECDIAAMANDLGSNLDQLLSQCRQRPMLDLFGQSQSPHKVGEIIGQGVKLKPHLVVAELPA